MAPNGVVEAVDVAGDGLLGFSPGLEDGTPDEFGLQRLEEGLDNGVIGAVLSQTSRSGCHVSSAPLGRPLSNIGCHDPNDGSPP